MQYYYNNKPVKVIGTLSQCCGKPGIAKIRENEFGSKILSVSMRDLTNFQLTENEWALECTARNIYNDLAYDGKGDKPTWVIGGNSMKQDECRDLAKKNLLENMVKPFVQQPVDEYMEADKNFYSSCQMSPFFKPGGLALAFNELSALAKQTVRERRIAHEMEVSKAVNHLASLPEPQLTESKPTVFFDNVEDMMKAADKEECGTPARMDFLKDLDLITQQVFNMLSEKNLKYGDSALNPSGIFAKCDPIELINVRIDDKLARIKNGAANEDEDPEWDLIGYLFLKRIAKMRQGRING